jgi:hypothetical protein
VIGRAPTVQVLGCHGGGLHDRGDSEGQVAAPLARDSAGLSLGSHTVHRIVAGFRRPAREPTCARVAGPATVCPDMLSAASQIQDLTRPPRFAAKLAIERLDDAALQTMEEQVERVRAAGMQVDLQANFELGLEFHDLLVAACGNRKVEALLCAHLLRFYGEISPLLPVR